MIPTLTKQNKAKSKPKLTVRNLKDQAARIREIALAKESLEAEEKLLRAEILDSVKAERKSNEIKGNFFKAASVESADGIDISVVFQDKYRDVSVEHEEVLIEALGQEYGSIFAKKCDIKTKPGLSLDKLKSILGDKMGAFEAAVEISEVLAPLSENLMARRASLRPRLNKTMNDSIDQVLDQVQYAPQIRVK